MVPDVFLTSGLVVLFFCIRNTHLWHTCNLYLLTYSIHIFYINWPMSKVFFIQYLDCSVVSNFIFLSIRISDFFHDKALQWEVKQILAWEIDWLWYCMEIDTAFSLEHHYINALAQDCGNSSALAMELPQSSAKPLILHILNIIIFIARKEPRKYVISLQNWYSICLSC